MNPPRVAWFDLARLQKCLLVRLYTHRPPRPACRMCVHANTPALTHSVPPSPQAPQRQPRLWHRCRDVVQKTKKMAGERGTPVFVQEKGQEALYPAINRPFPCVLKHGEQAELAALRRRDPGRPACPTPSCRFLPVPRDRFVGVWSCGKKDRKKARLSCAC